MLLAVKQYVIVMSIRLNVTKIAYVKLLENCPTTLWTPTFISFIVETHVFSADIS